MNGRALGGVGLAAGIFLLVQLGALALVPTFYDSGYQTVEDPADPTNSLVYVGAILLMTVLMLGAFRYDFDQVIRGVVIFTAGLLSWYVFVVFLPPLFAAVPAAGIALALVVYPEWYIIDAAGVLMGAGAAGLFGISFGLLPAIVLLVVLAVYDAVSVYGTEHMLDLAEGIMELNIPVVLVVPLTPSYSLLDREFAGVGGRDRSSASPSADGGTPTVERGGSAGDGDAEATDPRDDAADGGEGDAPDGSDVDRDVFFIGLGDAVMPTVMVASAAFFSPAPSLGVPGLPALNLPALCAMAGTFLGLGILLWAVLKGRAHAGLPLLNGGAIAGYLLGSAIAGVSLVRALGIGAYV